MQFKKTILGCALVLPLFAGDIMVERMQSVVNEVSELRERYEDAKDKNEACLLQLQEQSTQDCESKPSQEDIKRITELELENEKLKEVHAVAKKQAKRLKELESEVDILLKEKNRLNTSAQILVEKNHSLIEQINKFKNTTKESSDSKLLLVIKEKESVEQQLKVSEKKVIMLQKSNAELESSATVSVASVSSSSLEKQNAILRKALSKCQNKKQKTRVRVKNSKGICVDDNPFPKLLKKEPKVVPKKKVEPQSKSTSTSSSGVYRIKGESPIYNAKEGKVIEVWEDTRSFTSNVLKDEWIKITGYFVDKKWRKASDEMWVKKENTIPR